jgi:D-ribose pyranose/furanose isomerase RbsD
MQANVALKSNKASVATALHKKANKKDFDDLLKKIEDDVKKAEAVVAEKVKHNEAEIYNKLQDYA